MRIVDPHRTALLEWHERETLPVAGYEMEPAGDRVDEFPVLRGRAVEDAARGHVHVCRGPLQVEKRAVEAGEPIGIRHGADSCRSRDV
jgi:hypothetical protein